LKRSNRVAHPGILQRADRNDVSGPDVGGH
jgi:hypothetical protein